MSMLRLNDGHRIPRMGLGLWEVPAATAHETVAEALRMGYRLIDGAAIYGNEAGLRRGLRESSLPRDEVFVTTKIWNDRQGHDATLRAFDESVARLGTSPDLILIHWPCPAQVILRWHIQIGTSVIPRSTHPGRLAENLAAAALDLTPGEMAAIATLEAGARTGPDPATFG
jgi:diketogulonate reductase-like aldo/keto reductase